MFDWPKDGQLVVPGLKNAIESAILMAGGDKLTVVANASGIVISVPPRSPDAISSTVVLKIKGAINVEDP